MRPTLLKFSRRCLLFFKIRINRQYLLLFDEKGLLISRKGKEELLDVDQIIICAGQEPLKNLQEPLEQAGIKVHLIGVC